MNWRPVSVAHLSPVALRDQPAPQIMWVAIAQLVIDERYQRPMAARNWQAVQQIAEAFDWARFSPLLVAPVEGGRYAVIDGQHRAHAAALCGIEAVPASVVLVPAAAQALAFVQVNTRAIKVSPHQVYRAALVAGEAWALASRDAVAAAGCQLMDHQNVLARNKKPGQVYALAVVRDLVARGQARAVTAGLAALRAIEGGGSTDVALYDGALLYPWLTAVAYRPDWWRLDLEAVLRRNRPWIVIERADRSALDEGKQKGNARLAAFVDLLRVAGGE